jgi:hypothetical protein
MVSLRTDSDVNPPRPTVAGPRHLRINSGSKTESSKGRGWGGVSDVTVILVEFTGMSE